MNSNKQDEDSAHPREHSRRSPCIHSVKFYLRVLAICVGLFTIFILFQIYSLDVHPHSQIIPNAYNSFIPFGTSCNRPLSVAKPLEKLRQSVTFLPLKDLRYAKSALVDHTWFMSNLNDTHDDGEVTHQHFPSNSSKGRILCLKGRDTHDGSWNHYALAWPDALPENATLMEGLTYVSYNHYDYANIWHGLTAVLPFVGWHLRNGCRSPARWVLFHWGELRFSMGPWLASIMEAVYGADGVKIEGFEWVEGDTPVCFEEAVVMRHNEGGMSRQRREEVYDLLRCKARAYCNVTVDKNKAVFGVTMFMRTGGRSFKNNSHVIGIFERECRMIEGCRLQVEYPNNLTACQQVKVMSETDVLISPHGAQLTNMFLMEKGSSVMEFFPKGWLKLAGVGQHVHRWIASWSAMRHEGSWRDSEGPPCPHPENDRRCMSIFKNAQIGHNETHFSEWARTVFHGVRARKLEGASKPRDSETISCGCP